jgi:hypothetical protein
MFVWLYKNCSLHNIDTWFRVIPHATQLNLTVFGARKEVSFSYIIWHIFSLRPPFQITADAVAHAVPTGWVSRFGSRKPSPPTRDDNSSRNSFTPWPNCVAYNSRGQLPTFPSPVALWNASIGRWMRLSCATQTNGGLTHCLQSSAFAHPSRKIYKRP